MLNTFSVFKKTVEAGQTKLKSISEEKKKQKLKEEEEIAKKSSENSILPDVELDGQFGGKPVPPAMNEKAESLEDELEKRQSRKLENGNKVEQVNIFFFSSC